MIRGCWKWRIWKKKFDKNFIVLKNNTDRNIDRKERRKMVSISQPTEIVAPWRDIVRMCGGQGLKKGAKRELMFLRLIDKRENKLENEKGKKM